MGSTAYHALAGTIAVAALAAGGALVACAANLDGFSGGSAARSSGDDAGSKDAAVSDGAVVGSGAEGGVDAGGGDAGVSGRWSRPLGITNGASVELPASATVCASGAGILGVDLVASGHVRADYADLHVMGPAGETKHTIDAITTARSELCFRVQRVIAAGATDDGYRLVYGDPTASPPPDDGLDVFDLYDGFGGDAVDTGRWLVHGTPTVAGGLLTLPAAAGEPAITTTAAADPVPIAASLEMRLRVADPTSAGETQSDSSIFYYWFGFQHTGDFGASDPWSIFVARDKGTITAEHKTPSGTCNSDCADTARPQTAGQFRVYRIDRDGSGVVFRYDDGTTFRGDGTNGDLSVMLRNYLQTSAIDVDWVRARPLTLPEPTLSLGAETAAP